MDQAPGADEQPGQGHRGMYGGDLEVAHPPPRRRRLPRPVEVQERAGTTVQYPTETLVPTRSLSPFLPPRVLWCPDHPLPPPLASLSTGTCRPLPTSPTPLDVRATTLTRPKSTRGFFESFRPVPTHVVGCTLPLLPHPQPGPRCGRRPATPSCTVPSLFRTRPTPVVLPVPPRRRR